MAFFSLPAEVESLAHTIHEFQHDTGNKKASHIDSAFQELVDRVAATEPINSLLLGVSKRKTRAATSASSCFYNSSWLTNADKFPKAVARLKEITANSQVMDSSLKQSITSAVISAVATAVADIQTKHESKMLSLREMIEKSLLLRKSPPEPDATPKAYPAANSHPKNERWNQAELGYFDPHLDSVHGDGEVVSVRKEVYYRNVVLFVQRIQSLVTFRGAGLVKGNIATSLRGSALEWYTSELSDFDRDALNNNPGVKSWINILSCCFKVPTSVALGLLTDETYSLDDAHARRPPAQYVRTIMRHGIGCDIINVANQLSFAYRGLAPELRVFVSSPTESTKASDFICALEEKQEVWHEMMTAPSAPQRYYNPARRPSPYMLPLPSQSEFFARFQSQQRIPYAQLLWRRSERGPDATAPSPATNPQCQYTPQPFRQSFVSQRQQYPPRQQQRSQIPSSSAAISPAVRDNASPVGQLSRSTGCADASLPNRLTPMPASDLRPPVLCQPYQSGQSYRGYQRANEKGVYQIDDEEFDDRL